MKEIDWSRQVSKLIRDEYSAQFYKEIRKTFKGISDQNLPQKMKNHNNQMTKNKVEMSDVWASHYQNVSSCKNTKDFDDDFEKQIKTKVEQALRQDTELKNKFLEEPISPKEIMDVLNKIESNKSPGYDKISFKLWKTGKAHTTQFICNWLNFTVDQEAVTEELTTGLIISLYKGKKSKNNPANYRPITLLTSIFKILEGVVTNRIKKILIRDNIIHSEQAGYQKNRSAIENLFIIDKCLKISKQQKRKIFVTFMDISKAFDKAWRNGILAKLSEAGIKGKILRLINNFYTDTFSIARINGGFTNFW